MKFILILVLTIALSGCMHTSPSPIVAPTPDVYIAGGKGSETDDKTGERIRLVEEAKMEFLRSSVNVTLSGADKDIMHMESAKLSTPQIEQIVRPRLSDFSRAGFKEVTIVDATGVKQTIKITLTK